MSVRDTVFFIHVPKTAGTSFRLALEQKFPGRVAFDYGPKARDTSEWVRKHVHREPDREAFLRCFDEEQIVVFGGHVGHRDYGDLFSPARTITFVREPVARVVSEWHHHRRTVGMSDSLEEFVERPEIHNVQAKLLGDVPLREYGAVGISDCYAESLELVRRRFGWRLTYLYVNRNPDKALTAAYEIPPEIEARIRRLNGQDVTVFEKARALFRERLAGDPEARGTEPPQGWLDGYHDGAVVGWAYRPGDDAPAVLRVTVDDREVAMVVADRPRPDLLAKGIHPTGRAGFRAQVGRLETGSIIRCVAVPDGVELSGSPMRLEACHDD